MVPAALLGLAGAGAVAAAWGWFEAGWVRLEVESARIRRLPEELEGLRIAHLSDFHLGLPSRGTRAVERAVSWVEARKPDLTLISGDLLSRPAGEAKLRELVGRLPNAYAVLGNHDYAVTKDPFSRPVALEELGPARLLADEAETVEIRGRQVQLVGVDPRSYRRGTARPERLADPAADLRILLCHFPQVIDRLEPGVFDLVLSGHLHAGQITVPYPRGRLRLAHLRWTYVEGLYERICGDTG